MAKDVKLRILMWGDYPELSGWALNVVTSIYIKGRQRKMIQEKMMLQKQGERSEDWMLLTFKMEEVAIH